MAASVKDPVLVTLQLSGGNDYLNTVIPFNDPLYRDNRPAVGIADERSCTSTRTMASIRPWPR